MKRQFLARAIPMAIVSGLALAALMLVLLLVGRITVGATPAKGSTALDVRAQEITFTKSVDAVVAAPGERRAYQLVLYADQDVAGARMTDTLPSAVTWAGVLSATGGSTHYGDGVLTWTGSLSAGVPVTLTYDVTVTHAPCYDGAVYTDIYTDVSNHALLEDGQGNVFTSTVAAFAIGIPFGTGSDRTFDIDFGDADNDGDLDLAVGNYGGNQVCWNNGDSTFDCESAFGGSNTNDVKWGDMDQDGDLDLVAANFWNNVNRLCFNNGDRTFTCTDFSWCSGPQTNCSAALGDVDGDGDLDIALGNQKAPDMIYYNNGDGTFTDTDTTCYPGATLDLGFGDVDKDEWLDLVVVGHGQNCVCINDGTGHFPSPPRCFTNRPPAVGTWRVALGDANGDGYLDIATADQQDYPIQVYLNDRYGYFTETIPVGSTWERTRGVAWGDVDGDGDLDIASGNSYQRTVVYFNEPITATPGFTLTKPVSLGSEPFPICGVAFGDVDGDGDLDLAVGSHGGQNIVYLNTLAWCVSGHVLRGSCGNPAPGVVVSAGPGHSATTDASGAYTIAGLMTGTYTLTPSKHGWTFEPVTRTVSVPPCATGQDFVGVPYLYLPMILKNYQP